MAWCSRCSGFTRRTQRRELSQELELFQENLNFKALSLFCWKSLIFNTLWHVLLCLYRCTYYWRNIKEVPVEFKLCLCSFCFPPLLFLVLTSRWQKSHIMILAPSLVDVSLVLIPGRLSWEVLNDTNEKCCIRGLPHPATSDTLNLIKVLLTFFINPSTLPTLSFHPQTGRNKWQQKRKNLCRADSNRNRWTII